MEPVVPGKTEVAELEEVKRLRLCRRMQAVTIELCMAYVQLWFDGIEHADHFSALPERMKTQVSRACGLTEKDFKREEIESYGTEESTDEKRVIGPNSGREFIIRNPAD